MYSLITLAPLLISLAAAAPFATRAVNASCDTLAVNSGAPIPGNGSTTAYLADSILQATAESALTPPGYVAAFTDAFGSVQDVNSYLTYYTLNATYDTAACADFCTADPKCTAFNIYFARDPMFEVSPTCVDPPPVTNVRCALFSANVAPELATNTHQFTAPDQSTSFERLHVGSNGYNAAPGDDVPAFHLQDTLGAFAIEAVAQDDAENGYMTVYTLPNTTATAPAACAQQCATAYTATKHCVFFNTYVELVNGTNTLGGTKCALFAKPYGPERATNAGYAGGGVNVTIQESRSFVCDGC
ncbi:hypothetical protein P171DRAFT_515335 [Karstenula rhodostoma CBS 690.94]|uniref:Apple domain-containing protein n=1 Tax=Karstenula rhodostoma CBS 690.94 TaxID=1392251 RepID=A0A9P4PY23_9PLEO|nr:hypothetical protein P171DRAFT_515335 [Karstenula rhodostoma CBS 690.94]